MVAVISSFASPILETEVRDSGDFVEVGYIADTHGVHGELHVYSLTDFPEERFETVTVINPTLICVVSQFRKLQFYVTVILTIHIIRILFVSYLVTVYTR